MATPPRSPSTKSSADLLKSDQARMAKAGENRGLRPRATAEVERAVLRSGTPAEIAGMKKAAKVPSAPAEGLAKSNLAESNIPKATALREKEALKGLQRSQDAAQSRLKVGGALGRRLGGVAKIAGEAMKGLNVVDTLPIPKEEFDRGMAKARSRFEAERKLRKPRSA